MGVWDSGSFGNDTALDFATGLQDFNVIRDTLVDISKKSEVLDADSASIALAACDLLAAAQGRPPADLPDIAGLKYETVSDDLLTLARTVVDQVRKDSELADLWSEEGDEEWQAAVNGLLARLDLSVPYEAERKPSSLKLPDDFIGHCYICYEPVTERDGFIFEHTLPLGGTLSLHPHRRCIEKRVARPDWEEGGSPGENIRKQLLLDMGL